MKETTGTTDLKSNILWNTSGTVFYQGCLWLMTVLVARMSSDYQNAGMLAFAMSVGNVYTAIGTFTMRTFQVSDIAEKYSSSNYIAFRIFTVGLGFILCAIYGIIVSPSIETTLVILSFLLFKADESFVNVFYGCDQKAKRLDIVGKSQFIRGLLIIVLFVLGMKATDNLSLSLCCIFFACIATTIIFDRAQTKSTTSSIVPSIKKSQCFTLFKICLPTVVGNVIAGLIVSAARQYFGIAFGEEALGIYATVATPCVIIQVLAQNLYAPLLLPIAETLHDEGAKEAWKKAAKMILMVMTVSVVLSILLITVSNPLLHFLYGNTILPYVNVLPMALLVMSEIAVSYAITDVLIIYGKLKQTLMLSFIAFICMGICIIPLTNAWYMNGLNATLIIAYAIAIIYGLITIYFSVKKDDDHR